MIKIFINRSTDQKCSKCKGAEQENEPRKFCSVSLNDLLWLALGYKVLTNVSWANVAWTIDARTSINWPNPYRIWTILNKCCQDLFNGSWDMTAWTNVVRTNVTWQMVHIHEEFSMIGSTNFCDNCGVLRFLRWGPTPRCLQNAFLWLVVKGR